MGNDETLRRDSLRVSHAGLSLTQPALRFLTQDPVTGLSKVGAACCQLLLSLCGAHRTWDSVPWSPTLHRSWEVTEGWRGV